VRRRLLRLGLRSRAARIYGLRASAAPAVLVITAAGTLARRITLELPSPDSKVAEMRVAQGQIVSIVRQSSSDLTRMEKPNGRAEPVIYEFSSGVCVVFDVFGGNKLAEHGCAHGLLARSSASTDGWYRIPQRDKRRGSSDYPSPCELAPLRCPASALRPDQESTAPAPGAILRQTNYLFVPCNYPLG
jgi:hypothetical protein